MIPLLALQGCMSLDGMVIPSHPVDAYDFSSDVVPAGAIEEVTFESGDGAELWGVWARHDPPRPPLIWIHGNGSAMDGTMDRIETYWSWGTHDVFAFDYRGYGRSAQPGTGEGILELDGLAAVRFVSDTTGYAPDEIPWVTLSLGAAVAVHTNDEIPAAAIVLESMFPSIDALVDDGSGLDLPPGWFFRGEWDNLEATRTTQSPLFIVHGLEDDFIDDRYAVEVFEAAPGARRLWQPEGVGHSDVHTVLPDAYRERVLDFFADPHGDAP